MDRNLHQARYIHIFLSNAIFGAKEVVFLPKTRFDRNPSPFYPLLFCQMPFSAQKRPVIGELAREHVKIVLDSDIWVA
jgi:hypothetical protein